VRESILVFKTSVQTVHQVKKLKPLINNLLPKVVWNFDLEDCDRIFRAITTDDSKPKIINLFNKNNFHCEELYD